MLDFDYPNLESAIQEQGEIMLSTAGTSMYPMLRNKRDMVVIEKVTRPLKRHDVPLYRLKSGKLVLHRILKVTSNGYVIRGDNLYKKEFNVTDQNIIGVLKSFYRNGKFYDCEKSISYEVYVFWIRLSYPLRHLWGAITRPFLSKIKRFIIKNNRDT